MLLFNCKTFNFMFTCFENKNFTHICVIIFSIHTCINVFVFVTDDLFVLHKDKSEETTVLDMNEVYVFELILLLVQDFYIIVYLKSFQSLVLVSQDSV